jgi:hypothetical protein
MIERLNRAVRKHVRAMRRCEEAQELVSAGEEE